MTKKALDLNDFLQRVQDDQELLLELLDIFESYYPEKRSEIELLMQKGDLEQIKDIIHSIKGAAGNISAHEIHGTCVQIEKLALDKNMDGIRAALKTLDVRFEELKECMADIRKDFGKK